MSDVDRSADRAISGLLMVTLGGAQLRRVGGLCVLCQPLGRCANLVRFEINLDASPPIFAARRYCDRQAVFGAVPVGPRKVDQLGHDGGV